MVEQAYLFDTMKYASIHDVSNQQTPNIKPLFTVLWANTYLQIKRNDQVFH